MSKRLSDEEQKFRMDLSESKSSYANKILAFMDYSGATRKYEDYKRLLRRLKSIRHKNPQAFDKMWYDSRPSTMNAEYFAEVYSDLTGYALNTLGWGEDYVESAMLFANQAYGYGDESGIDNAYYGEDIEYTEGDGYGGLE